MLLELGTFRLRATRPRKYSDGVCCSGRASRPSLMSGDFQTGKTRPRLSVSELMSGKKAREVLYATLQRTRPRLTPVEVTISGRPARRAQSSEHGHGGQQLNTRPCQNCDSQSGAGPPAKWLEVISFCAPAVTTPRREVPGAAASSFHCYASGPPVGGPSCLPPGGGLLVTRSSDVLRPLLEPFYKTY